MVGRHRGARLCEDQIFYTDARNACFALIPVPEGFDARDLFRELRVTHAASLVDAREKKDGKPRPPSRKPAPPWN